ncbi:hypothetical protein [Fulvimarina sp. MAC8]|uniref:hypothetical protein n=1 Tax=Fulvimarina sp. MAC8 TaxID=3162874 RepID=UPI0032EC2E83
MAQTQADALLTLEDRQDSTQKFSLKGFEYLDFTTSKLEGFIWNKTDKPVEEFQTSELFTEFFEVYLGYDPVNRDQGEIHVFAAKIKPAKVGLAADYARFFASEWGPLNFGVKAHDPKFGEVMTGRKNEDGVQDFTRISVFRRADELLIIRADGPEESWDSFGPNIAAFVGSIRFNQSLDEDPVLASFEERDLSLTSTAGAGKKIVVELPPAWKPLPIENTQDPKLGAFAFFIDEADEQKNSAAMLFSVDARGASGSVEDKSAQLAETLGEILLDNVLPDQPRKIEALGKVWKFPELNGLVDFNGLHSFKLTFPKLAMPAGLDVFLSIKEGHVVGYAVLSTYPTDMWHRAATLNPTLVEYQLRIGIEDYWKT